MSDVHASLENMRRFLGREARSNSRYDAVRLAAQEGPLTQATVAARLGLKAPTAKELLERLRDDGFILIEHDRGRPRYRATELGARLVRTLDAAVTHGVAVDLVEHVLVCAQRPRGRADSALRAAMLDSAISVFSGFGSFQYVGVCADDPELVAALQGRIEELGASAEAFRVSKRIEVLEAVEDLEGPSQATPR